MNKEIWKDIKGFEGLYQISNYGRVKSLPRMVEMVREDTNITLTRFNKGRILKQKRTKDGYCEIALYNCNDKKRKYYRVHRLVAEAFLPNPTCLPCVNHKNNIKDDNYVWNLEWCTVQYNTKYAYDNNEGGLRDKCLAQLDKLNNEYNPHNVKIDAYYNNEYYGSYNSMVEASDATKVCVKTIYNRLHNRFSSRNGWDFKEVVEVA